jgi:hypothetical protein
MPIDICAIATRQDVPGDAFNDRHVASIRLPRLPDSKQIPRVKIEEPAFNRGRAA